MNKTILFVSHKKAQCGVYEFGRNITDALRASTRYRFVRVECSSLEELNGAIAENAPAALIYNYMDAVMPWAATKIAPRVYQNNIASARIPQIGIIHDVTQAVADAATNYRNRFLPGTGARLPNSLFDYYIAPDPTLLLRNPVVYKTGRLVPQFLNDAALPSRPVIGSLGFGTPGKGFDKIVRLVQQEFDEAVIRFNIPSADFGDKDGSQARVIAEQCNALVAKPGIRLDITHEFLDPSAMLKFLAQNSVNVFLYEDQKNRGLSSAIDNAMAARRPIAISDSTMFRHLFDVVPSICIGKNSLKNIIDNGFAPLEKHYADWTAANLVWDYERILDSIFARQLNPPRTRFGFRGRLKSKARRILSLPDWTFTWLRDSAGIDDDEMTVVERAQYSPVLIPDGTPFNRILDDEARKLYKPAIDKLAELVPKTIAKKIPEANVQQAFVFDTVYRHLSSYKNPKILCVGSYEDTASMSLRRLGCVIEEIDPVINYYLQEFGTKPTTVKGSYDIVFSTSVIEHDPDDESFVSCIQELLAPGGLAVMTCDYKDGWKPGDSKPDVDARFYTKRDLTERLPSVMKDCRFVDAPQWDCPNPDFLLAGIYRYTFATFVVRKDPRPR